MVAARNSTFDRIRIIALVLVIFIHSPIDVDKSKEMIPYFLQSFLGVGAVPAFFLLAGYLGAKKISNPTLTFQNFGKAKFFSLIVPFLFWNALLLLVVLGIKLLGWNKGIQGNGAYFGVDYSLSSILSALLGIGRWPILHQFWFLRDLIVAVYLSFFICRKFPRLSFLPWLLFLFPPSFSSLPSSLALYLLGHQFYLLVPSSEFPTRRTGFVFCCFWLTIGLLFVSGFLQIPYPIGPIGSAISIFMLALYLDLNPPRSLALGGWAFFLFATHQPSEAIFAKIFKSLHIPDYGNLMYFLLVPVLVIILLTFLYLIMKKFVPRLLDFATGGR